MDSDRVLKIWRAAIDTGGGKYKEVSSTEETYLWLQKYILGNRGCRVWGVKGSSNPLPTKLRMGSVLNKTPSGRALKMGMRLVLLDTDKVKDMFFERIGKSIAGETGGAWLHNKTNVEYAKQITAEEKQINDKGIEKWVQKGVDNHYLDCECLASIVADWEWPGGGVNLFPDPEKLMKKIKKNSRDREGTAGADLPGLIRDRV